MCSGLSVRRKKNQHKKCDWTKDNLRSSVKQIVPIPDLQYLPLSLIIGKADVIQNVSKQIAYTW